MLDMVKGKQSKSIQEALKQIPNFNGIKKVCMDMCSSFAHAVNEVLPWAEIITDRFHLIRHLNDALNTKRKATHPTLDKKQRKRFSRIHFLLGRDYATLGKDNRRLVCDYLRLNPVLKPLYELCQIFRRDILFKDWHGKPLEAAMALTQWVNNARKHFPDFVKTIEKWWQPVLNACLFTESNGRMEGMNQKIKLIKRQGFGYPERELFKLKVMAAFNP